MPLLLALAAGIRRELDHVRNDAAAVRTDMQAGLAAVRADVAEVRRDLRDLGERVARIEGALTGPWRPPANGGTAPAPSVSTPEAAA